MIDNTRFNSLVDVLQARANSTHSIHIIEGQDTSHSVRLSEMLQRATQRLSAFQAAGVKAGDYLVVQSNDIALFLEGFWACVLGGIVAVPLAGGNSREHRLKLFRIADMLSKPFIFTDDANMERLQQFAAENDLQQAMASLQTRHCSSDATAGRAEDAIIASPDQHSTVFVQFSSGSTSTPKGIVLTHHNLLTNIVDIIEGFKTSSADHLMSWMPLTHDMGLIGFHLTPVVCDASHSLMPTALFVRRPGLWLTEAQRLQATVLCSPNFGYQHLLKSFKAERYDGLDLSKVRLVFNGAEPISVALCEQFMQTLEPFALASNVMFPVYGLAEASLAVCFPPINRSLNVMTIERASLLQGEAVVTVPAGKAGVSFVSVGKPLSSMQVMIRDDASRLCAERVIGRICIHGDNVTAGYLNEPELNAQLIDADGWLDTGDLGFMAGGELFITGRAKDLIFINGQNVYPHDLEEILVQQQLVERGKLAIASSSVAKSGAANDTEQLLVFVLHRGELSGLEALGRDITRTLGTQAGVAVAGIVSVPRMPKTTSGKVQRFQLIREYEAGEYQVLQQSPPPLVKQSGEQAEVVAFGSGDSLSGSGLITTVIAATDNAQPEDPSAPDLSTPDQSTKDQLLRICNQQIENMEVAADDNLFELGISSLTLAEIHAAIDDRWPDKVDVTDLFDYPTVTELAAFLDARI